MKIFFPKNLPLKNKVIIALVGLLLVIAPLLHILIGLNSNCFHLIDYGIYQQAIYEIAAGNSWNPYVTVRDIFIFNEHFDPVIMLAVPFVWLTGYAHWSLGVFEWFWYLGFVIAAWKLFDPKETKDYLILMSFLFFSRGVLSAVLFSGHPVTWAILPLLVLTYFLKEDHFWGVFITSLLLCFFKETFAFGIVGLSGSYLLRRRWKEFGLIFVLGFFFVIFELKLRAILIGKTIGYGNMFLGQLISSPIGFFIELYKSFDFKSLFKLFIPFYLPIFLIVRTHIKKQLTIREWLETFEFRVFCFFLPMFLIHVIINRFYFHHASKFSVLLIGLVLFSGFSNHLKKQRPWLISLVVIGALAGGVSMYTKMSKSIFSGKVGSCQVIPRKSALKVKIKELIAGMSNHETVYTTGGIGPYILKPNLKLHQHVMNKRLEKYDYILLEREKSASIWPLNPEHVSLIIERCRPMASEVIMDNELFFFAKGDFHSGCIFDGTPTK